MRRRGAREERGQRTVERHFGGDGDLVEHLARRVIGQDRHRGLRHDVAVVGLRLSCSAALHRFSRSPISTAQFTGARPRYFGSSDPCMLSAPMRRQREQRRPQHPPVVEREQEIGRKRRDCAQRCPARCGSSGASRRDPVVCRRRGHRVEPDLSPGSSACVTTSGTSMPCASSTFRQRTPTLW